MVKISSIARNTALLSFLSICVRADENDVAVGESGPKPAYVKSDPIPMKWTPCKERTAETPGMGEKDTAQGRQAITAVGIGAGITAVFGVISSVISAGNGIASLIRQGKDLLELFGVSKKENAILIDNRCGGSNCQLRIRCYSLTKDTGWFDVEKSDGTILKFTTYLPNNTPLNVGLTNWKCDYEDTQNHKRITKDAFGFTAPRQTFNLFEVRDKGVWTMDKETGRIDIRQKVAFW